MTRIRVSIVTYNNAVTIKRCLESVFSQKGNFELAVSIVDNDSNDGTADRVRTGFADVELILPGKNLGFGAGHNTVLRECSESYALVLNPDAWLEDGAVNQLLKALDERDDIALVGPRMEYEDGRPQLSFGSFPGFFADMRQRRFTRAIQAGQEDAINRLENLLESPSEPDWISGSCFLARTEALREVGYFDERFFLYLEDVDLCQRLRSAGRHIWIEPGAVCRHLEGHSHSGSHSSQEHFRRSRLIYENKHGSRVSFYLYRLLRARSVDLRWDSKLSGAGPA